jgi:hypothetical protein
MIDATTEMGTTNSVQKWTEVKSYLDNFCRNRLITLRLFDHETDANHFREESRHPDLDGYGHLYDWRDDLRTLRCVRYPSRGRLRKISG